MYSFLAIRGYRQEVQKHLQTCAYDNREAHYIEGAKHLFALHDRTKGMRHLKISATKNYKRGKYMYAIRKLLAGDHVEGMNLLDVHKWRSNTYVVDKLWNQVKRSLHEVPIIKNNFYGTNMILIMPPRACKLNKLENRCSKCFYYKEMVMFMELVHCG
ncbi:hypothetical protein DY000_02025249 [Brassica cretica]|uniref:At2g35280-like TPR domain-containing protein n=1 Tax=Brassica cretica TaxID=69181 RepID=A0ABQ7E6H6_BRACR|nr:hypothetical protein DY000_02025249 [Brassica cretica]